MKRNLEIDRLRAIGALIVVICHFMLIYDANTVSLFSNGFAITILDLFFAISGFVISATLISQIDNLRNENVSLIAFIKSFAVRRIFRVYPPLWAVFFMVLLLSIIFSAYNTHAIATSMIHEKFTSPSVIINDSLLLLTSTYNFYFINNNFSLALAPCWTLTIEEQFYISFPIFLMLTKNNAQRAKILIFMIALVTFVLRPLTMHFYPFEGLYFTQTHCDALMYGCLIYILSVQPWFENLKPANHGNRWLRMGLVILLLYIIIGLTTLHYSPAIYLPVNALVCSLLLICATFERNMIVFPAIIQKCLDVLADRTYMLYLVHIPVIMLVNELFMQYNISTPAYLIPQMITAAFMIMIVNELFYRLILKPSMRKGKTISSNILNAANKTTPDDQPSLALLG